MKKILFNIRKDYLSNMGGDTTQILRTAESLREFNIEIDITSSLSPDLRQYDIVHLFNLTRVRETYLQCINAKKNQKPIAFSTNYWSTDEFNKKGMHHFSKKIFHRAIKNNETKFRLKKVINHFYKLNTNENMQPNLGLIKQQKFIAANSDILLPNSYMEMDQLKKDLNIKTNYVVVYNSADKRFKQGSPEDFLKKFKKYNLEKDNFVLCVSRIEDRKNILRLIRAVNKTDLKLVIIGKPNPSQHSYNRKCKKTAKPNIIFLNHMNQNELSSAYAAAKVHILPSWYETPGLSSLEAGLAGCNLVSTDRGSTREYFLNLIEYCDPSSVESIKNALIRAFIKQKTKAMSNRITSNFTWRKSSEQIISAYRQISKK